MNFKILVLLIFLPLHTAHARFFIDLGRVAVADRERWYTLFQPVEDDLKTPLGHDQIQKLLSALDQQFGTIHAREILQILKTSFGDPLPRLTIASASEIFLKFKTTTARYRVVSEKGGITIFESPTTDFPTGRIKKIRINALNSDVEVVAAILDQTLIPKGVDHVLQAIESLGNSPTLAKDLAQKLKLSRVSYRMIPQKMALQVAETPNEKYPNGRVFTLAYAKPAGMDEDFEGAGRNQILAVQVERLLIEKGWSIEKIQSQIEMVNTKRAYQVPEVPMNYLCRLLLQLLPVAD